MQMFILFTAGIHKLSKISSTHLQNMGARKGAWRKLHTEDSKFLSEFWTSLGFLFGACELKHILICNEAIPQLFFLPLLQVLQTPCYVRRF
jgi:hypothetical protein